MIETVTSEGNNILQDSCGAVNLLPSYGASAGPTYFVTRLKGPLVVEHCGYDSIGLGHYH
jgi:hypothetical protein